MNLRDNLKLPGVPLLDCEERSILNYESLSVGQGTMCKTFFTRSLEQTDNVWERHILATNPGQVA